MLADERTVVRLGGIVGLREEIVADGNGITSKTSFSFEGWKQIAISQSKTTSSRR